MKTDIIIQARMGSTRLPGKVLKTILDKPMLHYQIERLRRSKTVSDLIVATTINKEDDQIEQLCQQEGVLIFRGDESDVLGRYLAAAETFNSEIIVRITADCPCIDPEVIDKVVLAYSNDDPGADYLCNTLHRTYPRGLDVEVFSRKKLKEVAAMTNHPLDREHVTRYFYQHPELFSLRNIADEKDHSHLRLTVDTEEDFALITKIYEELYPVNPTFNLEDILKILTSNPDWEKINDHTKQKVV